MKNNRKTVSRNPKAFHDYFIDETIQAGLCLAGTEVKSLRMCACSIKESFVRIENGEAFLYGCNIQPYELGNIFNKDPLRVRKLLLHKTEINKLSEHLKNTGCAVVPLEVYFENGKAKIDLGVCRGKKLYDKRQAEKERDSRREIERALACRY